MEQSTEQATEEIRWHTAIAREAPTTADDVRRYVEALDPADAVESAAMLAYAVLGRADSAAVQLLARQTLRSVRCQWAANADNELQVDALLEDIRMLVWPLCQPARTPGIGDVYVELDRTRYEYEQARRRLTDQALRLADATARRDAAEAAALAAGVDAGAIAGSNPTAVKMSRDAFLAGEHEAAVAWREGCRALQGIEELHEQAKCDLAVAEMGVRVLEVQVQLLGTPYGRPAPASWSATHDAR